MKTVLVAYFSAAGTTRQMAEFIAEGVRFGGQEAITKSIDDIKDAAGLGGYDGYIFGSPTYTLNIPPPMQAFLQMADKSALKGKPGGAFGAYTHDVNYQHDAHAPALILSNMEKAGKMKPFELGPLILREDILKTREGIKACQDYGRIFGEKLG